MAHLMYLIVVFFNKTSKILFFSDSKLTRILQQSIGGNARTALIINCSPAAINSPETLSTLRFGTRAKKITNTAKVNVEMSASQLKSMLEISQLEVKRLQDLLSKNSINSPSINDFSISREISSPQSYFHNHSSLLQPSNVKCLIFMYYNIRILILVLMYYSD